MCLGSDTRKYLRRVRCKETKGEPRRRRARAPFFNLMPVNNLTCSSLIYRRRCVFPFGAPLFRGVGGVGEAAVGGSGGEGYFLPYCQKSSHPLALCFSNETSESIARRIGVTSTQSL